MREEVTGSKKEIFWSMWAKHSNTKDLKGGNKTFALVSL